MADDNYQKELRCFMAREALERAIPDSIYKSIKTEFIAGSAWNYRARFQLHLNKDGQFAQKKFNSTELVAINNCPVAVPKIQDLIRQTGNLKKTDFKNKTNQRIHIFSANQKIFTSENAADCIATICEKDIRFNPLGFFQSNLEMTEKLISAIFENIKKNADKTSDNSNHSYRILDFYSGVGTLSLFATEYASEIHLVEHNKYAHQYARINFDADPFVKAKKTKVFYHTMNAEKWAKSQEATLKFDIALVDPPRSGIDKISLNWFCQNNISKIYYVSCDPVSFARDAAKLLQEGYKLEKHFLFDFYPQTHHIETLGIFSLD